MSIPRIDFINELVGYAVGFNGSNGMVGKTTDGGTTWNIQHIISARQLIGLQFINLDTGIIVGNFGIILKTTDAGNTWVNKLAGSKANLYDVCSIDSNRVFAVGNSGTILSTSNGGINWLAQISNTITDLTAVYFINQDTGYVVGKSGLIMKTIDGGTNWNSVSSGVSNHLESIYFPNSDLGFIAGQNGIILKSTNGGNNWVIKSSGTTSNLISVYFVDTQTGFAVGTNGTIIKSTNVGENWINQTSGVTTTLNDIKFSDQSTGLTVGSNGVILKTTNSGISWISQVSGTTDPLYSISYLPNFNGSAVYVAGGYSAGGADVEGKVINSTDGGNIWVSNDCESSRILYSIGFPNSTTGFAVGEGGTIIKTFNAIVPVELTTFTSSITGNDVTLNWCTATEINNQGFQIERSNKLEAKSGEWESIGFVIGNGTTTEAQSYSFADENLSAGEYQYRLKQIDYDGTFEYSNTIEVNIDLPKTFALLNCFPNPFNPSTKIIYEIPKQSNVLLKVYDILGNEVSILVNEMQSAGSYQIVFDASELSNGVYFYKLQAGNFVQTRKMILLK